MSIVPPLQSHDIGEGMSLRTILAEEGLLPRAAAYDENEWAALMAANQLAKKLDLPVAFRQWETQSHKVPVPNGFKSLFKTIVVELAVTLGGSARQDWGTVRWSYTHPKNLGSNGLTVGRVSFDGKSGQWAWSVDGSNDYGLIPWPRYPSDPV